VSATRQDNGRTAPKFRTSPLPEINRRRHAGQFISDIEDAARKLSEAAHDGAARLSECFETAAARSELPYDARSVLHLVMLATNVGVFLDTPPGSEDVERRKRVVRRRSRTL